MIFNKDVCSLGEFAVSNDSIWSESLRTLPQFFRATPEFVWRLGGPIYRKFLSAIQFSGEFKYISIDSRVHMLMPGWYPCIPGWHCDDFYRPNGQQPDLVNVPPMVHYAMVLGSTAFTEFISKPIELPSPDTFNSDRPLYAHYNEYIEQLKQFKLATIHVKSGEIIRFTGLDFHRGTAATNSSWRLFVRATESDIQEPYNELRTQTQVYMPSPFEGW